MTKSRCSFTLDEDVITKLGKESDKLYLPKSTYLNMILKLFFERYKNQLIKVNIERVKEAGE